MAIDREKVLAAAQKYVEKKKYDKAVLEYQRIIQEDPNDARTLLKMGDLQSKMEAYGDAIASYERVGRFYASQGFSLKAIAVYKQIREIIARHVPQLEDKYAHITPMLAELYQQLGLTSDALATLDEVATRLQRQGKNQDALGVFRKIVELDPTNPLPHLRMAEALSQAKDPEAAIAEFGTAASQLLKLGRRDDALKVLERLLHHRPDAAHARMAAEAYLGRGGPNDGMQALAKLQICFQANPRDLDTLTLLARAFTHIGQAAKAIEVQKEMARIARDTGRADLFRELVTKLVKLAPNDEGVRQLAASSVAPGPASSIPPRTAAPAPAVQSASDDDEGSYEDVGEGDFEAEEQPIDLRRPMAATEPEAEIVVESTVDVVEEVGEPASSATLEQVARVLGEAATFRRSRIYTKAIETLRVGLELAPRSLEVHEMLRDVLLEAGHPREASAALLQIASLLVESLDGDAAARALQEALALDPSNGTAADMLHELGYELVPEEAPASSAAEPASGDAPAQRAAQGSYDPEAPLPAYDLEEGGPDDASIRTDIDREYRHAMATSRGDSEPSMRTTGGRPPARTIDEMD
ncbi:MAG TPA: tetratricopeptide repeat protein, partial [Polyangiaceae bacterium]|nr:tetratricopeptide repeat protein [Polyangiaceae bacterium]